ncbi:protein downstream neighbor of Son-like [Sycon ciliatum]|uniref:protein downstream neighbor of Son-like n=1 Tax=Sycon ciliatum TaxID=27933 RepID=UPI0031F720EF
MDAESLLSPRNPHRSVHIRKKRKSTSCQPLQPSSKENIPPYLHNAVQKKRKVPDSGLSERSILARSPLDSITNEARVQPVAGVSHATLPQDWSLKNSVRFTSTSSFAWADMVKSGRSNETAAGLTDFVRHSHAEETVPEIVSVDEASSDLRRTIQRHTMLWMHPSLPWLQLFPRTLLDGKISGQAASPLSVSMLLQPVMQTALQDAWLESFTSTYQLLRNGHSPYFYVCASQMTLLFRSKSEKAAGPPKVEILISPTTKGFRDALTSEDVCFSMPLHSQRSDQDAPESPTGSPKESKSEWLESIGLSVDNFPSLQDHHVFIQEARSHRHDFRPESLILIEGSSSQAFFNYVLCNSGQLVASTGSQTGLPPTILCPVAFSGATLHPLKVEVSTLRVAGRDGSSTHHSLEVSGAVLPHHVQTLCALLQACQGDLHLTTNVHEPTAAFNSLPDGQSVTFRKVSAREGGDMPWTVMQ